MMHYHGTPITPRAQLERMAGRMFCVSYAAPQDLATCLRIGQSVMLDWFGYSTDVLWAWPFGAPERFRMRKAGDHQDDVMLKGGWLSEIEPPEWDRLTAVFDDRDRVVQMWRDAGVTCFQVAPGEF